MLNFLLHLLCNCRCQGVSLIGQRKKRAFDSSLATKATYSTIFNASPANETLKTPEELSEIVLDVAQNVSLEIGGVNVPSAIVGNPIVSQGIHEIYT